MKNASSQYSIFANAGCLINSDLGGSAIDATITSCRDLIWNNYLKPNYYSQGVSAYWLDETDGEGTHGCPPHGYDTSFGPAAAYSQLWVNSWISTFARPVALLGEAPLVLTRGVWAGAQRFGTVLWSSDIQSSFEQLASMIPQVSQYSTTRMTTYNDYYFLLYSFTFTFYYSFLLFLLLQPSFFSIINKHKPFLTHFYYSIFPILLF